MSGREQTVAVALLMAAAEALRDPNAQPLEKRRVVEQIERFLNHEPVEAPTRVMHKFKPGVVDGPEPPPTMKNEYVVCENADLAWAIVMDELPSDDVRATMPPHTLCRVCFPDAPRAA